MLRSCYSTWARFGSDQSQASRIVWYWSQPGARDLGIPTPFCSRNYTAHGVYPELGEVEFAPRPWRDGSFGIAVSGLNGPCGSRGVWQFGYQGTIPPDFPRNNLGLLPCCDVLGASLGRPTIGWMVDPGSEPPTPQAISRRRRVADWDPEDGFWTWFPKRRRKQ